MHMDLFCHGRIKTALILKSKFYRCVQKFMMAYSLFKQIKE